jgi:RimJ/RimL family protein N-acetyltransferase
MELRGERIILKNLELEDLTDRHRWLNNPEVTRFFTNQGSFPLSQTEMVQWFNTTVTRSHEEIHLAIWTHHGKHIGGAQLKAIDWRNRGAELGVFIGEISEWGKGVATEATQLLIQYGFLTLGLHRIWLRVDSENVAAINCYQKNGFRTDGIFRDEVYRNGEFHDSLVMSILKEEFTIPANPDGKK